MSEWERNCLTSQGAAERRQKKPEWEGGKGWEEGRRTKKRRCQAKDDVMAKGSGRIMKRQHGKESRDAIRDCATFKYYSEC